jgi:hypothetical protein
MTIRHVAMFRWNDGTRPSDVEQLASALDILATVVRGLESLEHGPDLAVRTGNADYAVVAALADREALLGYFQHPEHLRIIAEVLAPILESKDAVQFETAGS